MVMAVSFSQCDAVVVNKRFYILSQMPDLKILPGGDETEIGAKGTHIHTCVCTCAYTHVCTYARMFPPLALPPVTYPPTYSLHTNELTQSPFYLLFTHLTRTHIPTHLSRVSVIRSLLPTYPYSLICYALTYPLAHTHSSPTPTHSTTTLSPPYLLSLSHTLPTYSLSLSTIFTRSLSTPTHSPPQHNHPTTISHPPHPPRHQPLWRSKGSCVPRSGPVQWR